MSSTKSQVAVATNIPSLSSSQSQKEYSTEEPLGRQNSFGNNRRGNMKGKHLTRSVAMREATSPPRTPTPRAEHGQVSPNGQSVSNYQQQHHHQQHQQQHMDGNDNSNINNNNNNNNTKLHAQSNIARGNSPIESPAVIVTSQHSQQQQQQQHQPNVVLCNEAEFPKLTPPKSTKGGGGAGGGGGVTAGQRNNNNNTSNNNSNNSNGIADGSNKIEYNNNSRKMTNTNANGGNGSVVYDTTKATNSQTNSHNTNKHQQYNASNALHQALNVGGEATTASRGGGGGGGGGVGTSLHNSGMNYQLNSNDNQQQQTHHQIAYDKENRCPRNDSQNSNMSNMHDDEPQHQQQHYERQGGGGGGGNKKHRTNSNSKGNKPRLKNIGGSSSGSVDGGNTSSNNTSGFISRVFNNSENSSEQFTDHGGTDLFSFFKETLNKHPKDRHFLLKVEKDLTEFVQEKSRGELRFPPASSYNRMLIHRTAAFFGMEHNVDTETQQCVIVAATKNTRIPETRFKSLVRDHREDTRKSILKRDTHSFDEARQSSYLCPDRGSMLDRKAKSFEEREEDYERARSRIFNRSQNDGGEGCMDDGYMNVSWTQSVEQQQQQHQPNRQRPNGKMMKMQNSNESRDSRSGGGAVPKSHNFNNYGGGATQGNGPPMMRGDSANSNKNGSGGGGGRSYSKQDSAGSTNTPWRLSPSSSGSIYHFDPSNLPPNQQVAYHPNQSNNNSVSYAQQPSPQHLQQQPQALQQQQQQIPPAQQQSQDFNTKKVKVTQQMPSPSPLTSPAVTPTPQQQPYCKNVACNESATTIPLAESMSESSTQTMTMCGDINCDGIGMEIPINSTEEASTQLSADECDNTSATGCLSITTTTSTKSYDRIEVQKFKNQATSPNIPDDKEELPKRENYAPVDTASIPPPVAPTAAVAPVATVTPQPPPPSQTPTNSVNNGPLHRETPHSARSTPFSTSDSTTQPKNRTTEEPKATSWTYTQSYQAPDGSTVFHTTATPSGAPYCTTTYQQGPDGSVYAIPQGMVYAYPPPPVEGEVQSYFMPVFDPNQQRTDATGLIPAGAQAIYPAAATAAAANTATMVPVAAAYPTAQFATANGTPIYPGQLVYSSDQFTTGGATVAAAAAAPPNTHLQQIPMTTYPIGYPYAYNAGYWGQPMTYYVPQQALTNAVTATPLLSAPPQPQPPTTATAQTVAGPHITGGINIANGFVAATAAAGPPSSNPTVGTLGSGSNSSSGNVVHAGINHGNVSTSTNNYQTHSGTTYFGTGRVKRQNSSHYSNHQSSGHQLVTATIPSNGSATTTYQLGHAVPTLTLAPTQGGSAAATNASSDLSVSNGTAPATAMYTLPHHTALLHANIFPYAPTASAAAAAVAAAAGTAAGVTVGTPPVHTSGAPQQTPASQLTAAGMANAAAHAQQTAVITPFYTHHHPPMTAATNQHIHGNSSTVHTPGPAAIPIVDPSTLTAISHTTPTGTSNTNNVTNVYSGGGGSATQSAPSTPHSVPTQTATRNPPLFSTPPIMNSNGGYSASSTPQYYTVSGGGSDGSTILMNSPHGTYVQHDKRNNNNTNTSGNKKPPAYPLSRQNSTQSYNGGSNGKPPLLSGNNDTRCSPNSGSSSGGGYQGTRPHGMNKRGGGGGDKPQTPLLSGPPSYGSGQTVSAVNNNNNTSYHVHHNNTSSEAKPPIRLNAGAPSFRHKGTASSTYEYRRSGSQRNSPGTGNSSSNDHSSNTSPNSIVGSGGGGGGTNTPNCYHTTPTGGYVNAGVSFAGGNMIGGGDHHQTVATATGTPLYITSARGAHIPPQLQHGGMMAAAAAAGGAAAGLAGTQQATTAAVLGGAAAAEVANAAAAAVAATVAHHQPLLSAYQPGASGVYIKYGQTYFAHPSVTLQNSRRSPSTELRPTMAPVAGMYPTVNMMIPAAPRHTQGRHPNPNYKGTRPR